MRPDGEFRGSLLWEASATRLTKDLWALRSSYDVAAIMIIAVVTIVSVVLILLSLYSTCIGAVIPLVVLLSTLGLMFLGRVLVRRYVTLRQPERVYEAGFTEPTISGRERFVPWAVTSGVFELEDYHDEMLARSIPHTIKRGDCLVVRSPTGGARVLEVGRENIERIISVARYQVGKADRVPSWYVSILRRRLLIAAPTAFVLALLLGALAGAFASFFGFIVGRGYPGAALAGLAVATALYVPILMAMDATAGNRNVRPLLRLLGVGGTVVLLVMSAWAVTGLGLRSMEFERTYQTLPYPGPSGIPMGEHRDAVFNLTEPVSVLRNETLVLENCTVEFDLPYQEVFGLWVEEGGRLELRNTTVTALPRDTTTSWGAPDEPFLVQIEGSAWIEGCVLDRLGGWQDAPYDVGGLVVLSDDVTVLNTTMSTPSTNGVVTFGCSPTISGCTILDASGDGIVCRGGAPTIEQCYIRDCQRGIVLDRSDARIEGCEVRGGAVGIRILDSDPTIAGCGVMGASEAAVTYDAYSDPDIEGLTLIDNGAGVVKERWMSPRERPLAMQLGGLCLPVYLLLGLLGVSLLFRRPRPSKAEQRRARKRERIERMASRQAPPEPDQAFVWANRVWDMTRTWALAPFAVKLPKDARPSLRDKPRGPFPANRGQLVTWLPLELRGSVWERWRGVLNLVPYLVLAAAPVLWALTRGVGWIVSYLLLLCLFILLATMYVWSWRDATARMVLEVYDNGVVAAGPIGRARYFPWGELGGVEEGASFQGIKVLTLDAVADRVRIDERMPLYGEARGLAEERARQAEYHARDPGDTPRGELLSRLTMVLPLWATLSAGGVAFVFRGGFPAPHVDPGILWELGALMCVLMGMPLVYAYIRPFVAESRYRLRRRVVIGAFAVAFIVATVAFANVFLVNAVALTQHPVTAWAQDDPGTSSLVEAEYIGQRLVVAGPVVVHDGETLTMVDSELVFDPPPGDAYGVWVGPGGRLVMVNTTVRPWEPGAGFTFEVHGSATVRGCRVEGTANWSKYSLMDHIVDSGLEIYSSDVLVEGTVFDSALGRAISTFACSPVIRGCTVNGSSSTGINLAGGAPTVEGCNITLCGRAMYVEDSAAVIRDCTVEGNGDGIYLDHSDAVIEGCFFDDNGGESIKYMKGESEPTLEGNRFSSGWPEIVIVNDTGLDILLLVMLLFAPLMVAYWVYEDRNKVVQNQMKKAGPAKGSKDAQDLMDQLVAELGIKADAEGSHKSGTARVKCPRCGVINYVETDERPYEFKCGNCRALMRLSR